MHFEGEGAVPLGSEWLSAPERERLAAMRFPRRRRDFRLGRWTAKQTIVRAFPELCREPFDAFDVRPDSRGAPHALHREKALPCTLSLSHRAGIALCAIAGPDVRLGCDLEWIEPRTAAFEDSFLAPTERSWLAARPASARATGANLLWSAKESAVKSLGIGLDVDARAVRIRVSDRTPRSFRVRMPDAGPELAGRWGIRDGWVWTLAGDDPEMLDRVTAGGGDT